jgi:hypothetical protein
VPPDESHRVGETSTAGTMRLTRLAATRDEHARTQTVLLRYEDAGEVSEREWLLHWHTQDGFRVLAEETGFEVSAVLAPSGGPAADDADEFVFVLTRSA